MRTSHFAVRCAYVRYLVWLHNIDIRHRGTCELEADGSTKVLGKAKLAVARRQLRIQHTRSESQEGVHWYLRGLRGLGFRVYGLFEGSEL